MKNILQAAALILLAASVVYAAAHSPEKNDFKCHSEWKQALNDKTIIPENIQYAAGN
jgi:opacity protein-like surface antigen